MNVILEVIFYIMAIKMAKNINLQMWKKNYVLALSEVVQMANVKGQNVFTSANGDFCHFKVCHNRRNDFWWKRQYSK